MMAVEPVIRSMLIIDRFTEPWMFGDDFHFSVSFNLEKRTLGTTVSEPLKQWRKCPAHTLASNEFV